MDHRHTATSQVSEKSLRQRVAWSPSDLKGSGRATFARQMHNKRAPYPMCRELV